MTVHVTYYHRQKDPAKASRKPKRGLFPALMLLGIANSLTPTVRRRMAKASALLDYSKKPKRCSLRQASRSA
ncbi:MAG: hypothetical protein R3C01_05235 [Planctomycetaceae bacterium]